MIEYINHGDKLFAIILRKDFSFDGIQFFTPGDYSQQLGYMKREGGYSIQPHIHNKVNRSVDFTNEVLFIKSGLVRVDFYDSDHIFIESRELRAGDVILLAHGGHGFEMLETSEIIEVKQGPYAGEGDKTRFSPNLESK
ncbi:hypothetical protein [Polynucleobacter sp. MWH-Berg-3C6]|uniref:cupin domain-containing protein n=1 Tax=Polynucleobacter sp. MWH-Berg-3C6 TaxID=1855882 RepID=UPI001C20E6D1|nr:hypothetical protein [Polynucleobacter sp. MWH-Berg-3C6]MBU3549895.1 hypothetical protein [Polynucleobacter sp. MWH-Berg-3C6]